MKKEKNNTSTKIEELTYDKEMKRDTNMRNANIRISSINIAHEDNEKLGVKKGEVIEIREEQILDTLNDWLGTKEFNYFLAMHDEDTKNIHWHLVLNFGDSMCKFSTIKNRFPYGNIESCKSVKACIQYLVHMNHPDKYQYSWDIVKSNVTDAVMDNYKIPGKKTMDARLQRTLDMIVSGKLKECDIPTMIESDIYIRYATKINNAFDYRRRVILNDSSRELNVIVFVGPPGVGKTTFVREYAKKHKKAVYFSGSGADFMGDYHYEDILCMDDYNYDRLCIEDCLKLLDPYTNTTIKSRYRNRIFTGDTIFILTNLNITEFYTKDEDALRMAFYRRISDVFVFGDLSEDYVVKYTINDIVPTDDWRTAVNYKSFDDYKYRKMKLVPKYEKEFIFDLKKYISFDDSQERNTSFINDLTDM